MNGGGEFISSPNNLVVVETATEDNLAVNSKISNDNRSKRLPRNKTKTPNSTSSDSKSELKISSVHQEGVIDLIESDPIDQYEPLGHFDELNESMLKTPSSEKRQKSSGGNKGTYISMVHDAIVTLKDRTGSSVPAITKCMISKNEHLTNIPSQQLSRLILVAIKSGVNVGRFVKVKCSYKVNSAWTKKEKLDAQKKEREKNRKKTHPVAKQGNLEDSLIKSNIDEMEVDHSRTDEELAEQKRQVSFSWFQRESFFSTL